MLFAPHNTLQKSICPHQMIQSLSYTGAVSHHGLQGCPCPVTTASVQPGWQVMPQRNWMMPDVVTEELCRAPATACRGHHVHIS